MNIDKLTAFIERAENQIRALDGFVAEQRAVSGAVRARDWPGLEQALERATQAAEAVAEAEERRLEAWESFLHDLGQPLDSTIFRASLALPVEYRTMLNDSYRMLRLSAMRARIENEALSGFVGGAASTLRLAMETLFPERKGHIYGRSGRPNSAKAGALILDTAL
ncbi:MAG: hypothetical protein JXM71_03450 [Spirochaetales bacterium]|nr:hypothetical protein [Spirochaetales bacterium]